MLSRTNMVRAFMARVLGSKSEKLATTPSDGEASTNYVLRKAQTALKNLSDQFYEEADEDPTDVSQRALRMALLLEELAELAAALLSRDEVEALDALSDIAYITEGCAIKWNMPLQEGFEEAHRSNMTKNAGANKSQQDRSTGNGKGKHYSPPDFAAVLKRHRGA